MAPPMVSLCYPHDADVRGKIAHLRDALQEELRGLTGERDFIIYQDIAEDLGNEWENRLEQELDPATFLVPIVQPLLFSSPECRARLEAFLKRERTLGRFDLVLPIYYIECDDFTRHSQDLLKQALAARKFEDFRKLRNASREAIDGAIVGIAERMCGVFKQVRRSLARNPAAKPPASATNGSNSSPSAAAPLGSAASSLPASTAPPTPKLRVLVVGANPVDLDQLDLDAEMQHVESELGVPTVARRVRIDIDISATAEDLLDNISALTPGLLHFAGHGNARGEPQLLALDDVSHSLSAALIDEMSRRAPQLRCIVLNTCWSARVATELVRRLPLVVVGMASNIEDTHAIMFTQHFYRSIARGRSLREAFNVARTALRIVETKAGTMPQIRVHASVDADEVYMLPPEGVGPAPAANPAPTQEAYPAILSPEQCRMVVELLQQMFSSSEFLRFLRFSSDTAPILLKIPNENAAPIHVFTSAVDALAQEKLLDRGFFDRILHERPRWESEVRHLQAEFARRR